MYQCCDQVKALGRNLEAPLAPLRRRGQKAAVTVFPPWPPSGHSMELSQAVLLEGSLR